MKHTIYIGWDRREAEAFDVARSSILKHSSHKTLRIVPLELPVLQSSGILTRPIEFKDGKMWCPISAAPMATEFAISRFAVPLLQKKRWALFCDCDVLVQADVNELFALADDKYAVMVVKHDHTPVETVKMDGQTQTTYQRKNWSSVVLWNCAHPSNAKLTIDILNAWPGRDLHAFKWLTDDEIGELPKEWNWLVGVYPDNPQAKILHYTLGGPWLANWAGGPMDELWLAQAKALSY